MNNPFWQIANDLRKRGAQPWRHAPPGYYPGFNQEGRIVTQKIWKTVKSGLICNVLLAVVLWFVGISVTFRDSSTLIVARPSKEFGVMTQVQYDKAVALLDDLARHPQQGPRYSFVATVLGNTTEIDGNRINVLKKIIDKWEGYDMNEKYSLFDQMLAETQGNYEKISISQLYEAINLPKDTFHYLFDNDAYNIRIFSDQIISNNLDISNVVEFNRFLQRRASEINALKTKLLNSKLQQDRQYAQIQQELANDANAARKKLSGIGSYLRCRDALQ